MGKVVILDPSLEGEMSHHYYAASALVHEMTELGVDWALAAHAKAGSAVLRLRALPHFHVSGYHHIAGARPEKEMETIALCNAVVLNDLLALEHDTFAPDDLVFFPAITANLVLAVAQWTATFPVDRAPCFGLCLMFQPNWHPSGGVSAAGEVFYRQAFPFIPERLRDRVVYTCESAPLAAEYEPIVGKPLLVAPIPTIQHLIFPSTNDDGGNVRIAFLGYGKDEKGFHLLPGIVRAVVRQCPRARFLVQLMSHDDALVARVRAALAVHGDAVTFVEGAVPAPRMVDLMQSARLLLLPYDARTYRTRYSALFTEARSVGLPMVLPAGTAIGEEGTRKGLAETFESFDATSIASATLRALTGLDRLTAAARRESARVRDERPGYVRPILEACGLVPAATEVPA